MNGARASAMVVEKDVVGPSAMVVESDSVGPHPWLQKLGATRKIAAEWTAESASLIHQEACP